MMSTVGHTGKRRRVFEVHVLETTLLLSGITNRERRTL
jgi:hypothetical protein